MERFGTISPTLTTPDPTTPPFLVNINANGTTSQDPAPVTRKAFYNAFIATNSISLAACVLAISVYFVLRRKHPRLMSRTSLKLSIAMACSDVIYHVRRLNEDLCTSVLIPSVPVCEFDALFRHSKRFCVWACRRMVVRDTLLSVNVFVLRNCIEYPIGRRASASSERQHANPLLCHTSDPRPPYL